MCAACHGGNDPSVVRNATHRAGQPEPCLVEQPKTRPGGKRAHEVMGRVAKPPTHSDIADLGASFASLEIALPKEP
jgi:cytochrome c553